MVVYYILIGISLLLFVLSIILGLFQKKIDRQCHNNVEEKKEKKETTQKKVDETIEII